MSEEKQTQTQTQEQTETETETKIKTETENEVDKSEVGVGDVLDGFGGGETLDVEDLEKDELAAEIELLKEENNRLRSQYITAKKTQYRRTAIAFIVIGVLSVVSGLFLEGSRNVLLALGGTGLFSGFLTYYLTPESFISASIGEKIYTVFSENQENIKKELGLQDTQLYIPIKKEDEIKVKLFIPKNTQYKIPTQQELNSYFIVTKNQETRGISTTPIGEPLIEELKQTLDQPLSNKTEILAQQLSSGLTETLEITQTATQQTDPENNRITISIEKNKYGKIDTTDHPIPSFIATGIAKAKTKPTKIEDITKNNQKNYTITCIWNE